MRTGTCARVILGSSVVAACSLVFVEFSLATTMGGSCNGLFRQNGISARQLYLGGQAVPDAAFSPRTRRPRIDLAYIIPAHAYTSGVLIIKYKHRLGSSLNARPTVALHRDSYKSPCVEKRDRQISEYNETSEVQRYLNYHKYKFPEARSVPEQARLYNFHADIGNRPARDPAHRSSYWESDGRCASTDDNDIAAQFLFEVSQSARQERASGQEWFEARAALTVAATRSEAYAAPGSYTEYHNLTAWVLPYRKSAGQLSCMAFSVSVPGNATQTELMIIDADDARNPRDYSIDPQRTWTFEWQ
jgi:hypothetical protein